MAGEKKGKTYEALVMIALRELKRRGRFHGNIFWNQKPSGMSIEPDFTVGPDPDHPELVFLITHSGAAGNSHMKFWRNMGELAEAKTFLPKMPRVYSLAFDSVIKEDLKKLQAAAFDGQVIVGDRDYGRDLQRWVDSKAAKLPKDGLQKVAAIHETLEEKGSGNDLQDLVKALVADIADLLKTSGPELDHLWKMERKRPLGRIPAARETFVRRGLSKVLIFEDLDLALRLYRGERVIPDKVPGYAYELDLARKAIGRAVGHDSEIRNAVSCLRDEEIRDILRHVPRGVDDWLVLLRNLPHLSFEGRYVLQEYDALCRPNVLASRLARLRDDPSELVDEGDAPENWPPRTVWLLEYLVELIKAGTGSANGYGYAQLGRDVLAAGFTRRKGRGNPRIWVGGFILSDWVHRRGAESLSEEALRGIATVLAARLGALGKPRASALVRDLPQKIQRNVIEAKLVTYREFSPLLQLLRRELKSVPLFRVRSCFAERSELGGQASKTLVGVVKSTMIDWQSVSDAGRDHKKKELCGRAVALRYSWAAKAEQFVPRPGIKKLILVVDGTWQQEDLNALARAGWDEIFYPDEMDKLGKAIL